MGHHVVDASRPPAEVEIAMAAPTAERMSKVWRFIDDVLVRRPNG
jgi:hypothetical protein